LCRAQAVGERQRSISLDSTLGGSETKSGKTERVFGTKPKVRSQTPLTGTGDSVWKTTISLLDDVKPAGQSFHAWHFLGKIAPAPAIRGLPSTSKQTYELNFSEVILSI